MTRGVVVDASVLSRTFAEIRGAAEEAKGPLEALLDQIIDHYGLATNRFVEQEWEDTCGLQYVDSWLAELMKAGKVQRLPASGSNEVRERLYRECGLPRNSPDSKYIDCARQIEPFYVFAEDMDFYDPREKLGTPASKRRARQKGQGPLCQLVRDCYQVTVGCYCHCGSDLELEVNPIRDGLHPCSDP